MKGKAMRASDQAKAQFERSHDQQIRQSQHDEVLKKLYRWLKSEKSDDFLSNGGAIKIIEKDVQIEAPILSINRRDVKPIGFADLLVIMKFEKNKHTWHCRVYIEVKTSVNIGETIRQINYYGGNDEISSWYVAAPSFKEFDILNDQRIGYIDTDLL